MSKEKLKQLIEKKLHKIPHGVDLTKFYPINKPRVDNLNNENVVPFTFLVNKGWRNLEDRGGTQYAIKAYFEEFKKEDNVEMLVKINPAYGIPNISQILIDLGHNDDSPDIKFDIGNYKYTDLVKLYNKCDVFVCPTRAEAFGIPGIEAKACGKMTIQTKYGGQTDYMKEGTDLFIEYELGEVMHELQYEGCCWAKVKIEDLRKKMRWCYDNQSEVKKRGQQALQESEGFTWDSTAEKIKELL